MSKTANNTAVLASIEESLYFNNMDIIKSLLKTAPGFECDENSIVCDKGMISLLTEEVVNRYYEPITIRELLNSISPKLAAIAETQCRAAEAKKTELANKAIAAENAGVTIINTAKVVELRPAANVPDMDRDEEFEASSANATPRESQAYDVCAIPFPAKLTPLNKSIYQPSWPGGYAASHDKSTGELKITPVNNFENFIYMLNEYGIRIRFNILRLSIDCELAPHIKLSKSDRTAFEFGQASSVKAIIMDLCVNNKFKATDALLNNHLFRSASSNSFNPIANYLNNLPKWDGKDYLAMCVSCLPSPSNYDREWGAELFKRHLVSWVAMSMEPGKARASSVFIITGGQGKGKSTFLSKLMPDLPHIFKDGVTLDTDNKDSRMQVLSHGAVELAEIAQTLSKSNVESFKQITSGLTREERPPYAAESIEMPRLTLFFGTSNDKDFLVDYSGSRRFWVWDVGNVGETGVIARMPKDFDVNKLWAQVKELYEAGTPYWFNEEEQLRNEKANSQFSGYNPVRDAILSAFEGALDNDLKPHTFIRMTSMSVKELATMCGVEIPRHSKEFSRQLRSIFGEPVKASVMKYRVPDMKRAAESGALDL